MADGNSLVMHPRPVRALHTKSCGPGRDDLIHSAGCRDGDRVLDVACGTGLVANRVNLFPGSYVRLQGLISTSYTRGRATQSVNRMAPRQRNQFAVRTRQL